MDRRYAWIIAAVIAVLIIAYLFWPTPDVPPMDAGQEQGSAPIEHTTAVS